MTPTPPAVRQLVADLAADLDRRLSRVEADVARLHTLPLPQAHAATLHEEARRV